jgi:outer membrane scaffolding protein for murein synthesis (MipA/OmpV family)
MVADRRRLLPGCVLLLAACVMPSARADDAPAEVAAAQAKPLWEVGLGLGAIAFEDYRGSATTHAYPVPVPYIIYRGEFLQADRDGVRGKLFNQDWLEINVSGNLTTPVRNDSERSGMPELRTTVELGPSFDFHLFKSADQKYKLDLRMPLRVAATVQSSPKWIGGTFTPRLNLDMLDPFGYAGWNLGLALGPEFADRRYNDYFYSVAPQYATLTRPPYQAAGGYAGTQSLAALSKRFRKFWVGAYTRYDLLQGAAFIDSPLVQRHSYWSAGIGFAWMIGQSSRLVNVPE